MSRKNLARAGALLAAALASLALAPAALAGTISFSQPCYVAGGIGRGANIAITGSGFTPGEDVFAQIPAPAGLLGYTEVTVAPDGSLAATVTDISPETIDPVVENRTMQIKGVLSDAIVAEAPFKLTNLAVKTKPPTAPPHKKVAYHFAGFGSGKPIFGHYLRHGRVLLTHKFGQAHGACGVLKVRAGLYPGPGGAKVKYKVQFDDHRKYSPKVGRKIVTSLTIF